MSYSRKAEDVLSTHKQYKRERQWSDEYIPAVQQLLGEAFRVNKEHITVTSDEMDTTEAADLEMKMSGQTIAVRLRKNTTFRDLTIRTQQYIGKQTEISKIKEGYADWYFYGWIDTMGILMEWMIVDMDEVRKHKLWEKKREIKNKDKTTGFIAIPRYELDKNECIHSQARS